MQQFLQKTLTLTDRAGGEHSYTLTPLPPGSNSDLAAEILAAIAEPGIRLIQKYADGADVEVKMADFMKDPNVAADIAAVLRSLATKPALVQRLFATTVRDGKPLRDQTNFDMAYGANWGELYQALAAVVQFNGFIPFLDSLAVEAPKSPSA